MSQEIVKTPDESRTVMTNLVLPQDTNALGGVFGGVVMSWIDVAAAIAAQRHSAKVCVTASVDELHFLRSVKKGYIVNVEAFLTCVHKTSCEVRVLVSAENPILREKFQTTKAFLTFVSLDSDGRPTPMPRLKATTQQEQELQKQAILRKKNRETFKKQLIKEKS